jgi:hypothetical protein
MAKRRKVRENEGFVFSNGQVVETRAQMVAALKTLDPAVFRFHVNEHKNDVYTWLRDCLDPELAEKVRHVRDQQKMVALLK